MKVQITSFLAAAAVVAMATAGCAGSKENKTDAATVEEQQVVANADIRGQWLIENIVFSDSDYVKPAEATPDASQYVIFQDSTYSIMTNCNSIQGPYEVKGDSIHLGDGLMTEMACENMSVEDALRRILPDLATVDVQSDSVVRLNGKTPAQYILLRKGAFEIK